MSKNENRFSELSTEVRCYKSFFFKEISDLRREMKDLIQTKITANTNQVGDVNEFLEVDENLKFLQKE